MDQLTQSYLSFRVGHEWYVVDVDDVIQVLHLVALTELPASPPDVLGLVTVRGTVMPVIDLRRRFNQGSAELRLDTPMIAVNTARGPVALVVDETEDIQQVGGDELIHYDGAESSYIKGVIRLRNRLLLLLDAAYLRGQIPQMGLEESTAAPA